MYHTAILQLEDKEHGGTVCVICTMSLLFYGIQNQFCPPLFDHLIII